MGKNKAKAPTLPRIRYMCFDLTHAATAARAATTGPVSMSTRPDPEGSHTVEIATASLPCQKNGSAAIPTAKTAIDGMVSI